MAKYKEIWQAPDDDTVVGIRDTETGASIPLAPGNADYRAYLEWIDAGNTPDPGYTTAQIDKAEADALEAIADRYVNQWGGQINTYRDAVDAGRTPPFSEYRYLNLLKKRAWARKHKYV